MSMALPGLVAYRWTVVVFSYVQFAIAIYSLLLELGYEHQAYNHFIAGSIKPSLDVH